MRLLSHGKHQTPCIRGTSFRQACPKSISRQHPSKTYEIRTMYYCRHEQDDDPYASGNENRRRNCDRLNRDIEARNIIRDIRRGGYGRGPSHLGFGPYGSGYGSPLNTFSEPPRPPRPPRYPGYPTFWGPTFSSSPDDFDSDDDESPSSWYYPPRPPHYGTSPCGGRSGTRYGGTYGGRYYTDSDDDYPYGYMPSLICRRRGRNY